MYAKDAPCLTSYKEALLKQAIQENTKETFPVPISGQQFLITKYYSKNSGWTMVSISDLSEITSTVHNSILRSLVIFGLIVVIIFGAAWLMATSFTQPLNDIQQVMADISSGDMSLRVSEYSSPDINNLAMQFNKMLDQIEILIEENNQKQKELIETELQMLHAQIHPHFIYNTLNSISWLAVFNGQTQIKTQLSNLTTLLRSAYSNPDQLITISDEKELLLCYTSIMKLRYDSFSLIFENDASAEQCLIPKCTLQPIVENSIIHGFPDLMRPSVIRILFHRVPDLNVLEITVEDNGVGMSPEQQEKCLHASGTKTHFNNIGIRNVNQRIQLKFGPEFGLSICSEEQKGTAVLIRIPLIYEKSEGPV